MQDQGWILHRTTLLLERTVVWAFGITVLLAMMFVAGNYQEFSDATQLQLLSALQALSGGVAVASVALNILELVSLMVGRRRGIVRRLISYVVIGVAAAVLAVSSSVLLVFLQPL